MGTKKQPNRIGMLDSVRSAVKRLDKRKFTLCELIESEGQRIVSETQTKAAVPSKSIQWALIQLRNEGSIQFLDYNGTYQIMS